jgi:predicted ATPase
VYHQKLTYSAGDALAFAEESIGPDKSQSTSLGVGHPETRFNEKATAESPIAGMVQHLLRQCRVYHFNDTSATARVRQHCYIGNNRALLPDASNLAAYLLRLSQESDGMAYQRIVRTIQQIAPFFEDFDLVEAAGAKKQTILNWRERITPEEFGTGSIGAFEEVFGPHQLSDGTLRAMCLITLLLQPEHELPHLIIVDEPELGLHPYALHVIASLFKRAAYHAQVLVATQSPSFLDNFEPEDIIVVDRKDGESQFRRHDAATLAAWLEDYSLGEVWEKNVIGGGPH